MKGLVKSDSPFKNILIHTSRDMLANNVSCQDFIYKVLYKYDSSQKEFLAKKNS